LIVVVMGVSGSGKSTLGRALARALGWPFLEGDDYHPPVNLEKMRAGIALTDADRWPWLERIRKEMAAVSGAGGSAVVACSALKGRYRALLSEGLEDVRFVYIAAAAGLIRSRLRRRTGHFMPPRLLDSQLAALEPPDDALLVPADLKTEDQIDLIRRTMCPECETRES
jgi:gluconokinase